MNHLYESDAVARKRPTIEIARRHRSNHFCDAIDAAGAMLFAFDRIRPTIGRAARREREGRRRRRAAAARDRPRRQQKTRLAAGFS
ncbi:hypothetical protein [Burkholderia gladioli]|uniref:hypothetical protein n=1 Tax=Burkholderia gladioli TaxID=28095 RepID=UPI00163ECB47|nr:hypothetical protein [Burkholderia gladioli]